MTSVKAFFLSRAPEPLSGTGHRRQVERKRDEILAVQKGLAAASLLVSTRSCLKSALVALNISRPRCLHQCYEISLNSRQNSISLYMFYIFLCKVRHVRGTAGKMCVWSGSRPARQLQKNTGTGRIPQRGVPTEARKASQAACKCHSHNWFSRRITEGRADQLQIGHVCMSPRRETCPRRLVQLAASEQEPQRPPARTLTSSKLPCEGEVEMQRAHRQRLGEAQKASVLRITSRAGAGPAGAASAAEAALPWWLTRRGVAVAWQR